MIFLHRFQNLVVAALFPLLGLFACLLIFIQLMTDSVSSTRGIYKLLAPLTALGLTALVLVSYALIFIGAEMGHISSGWALGLVLMNVPCVAGLAIFQSLLFHAFKAYPELAAELTAAKAQKDNRTTH